MAMVCPRCSTTHEQRLHCPGCGDPLDFSDPFRTGPPKASTTWQHTTWGRVLIGLLIAQGLYYGLRHLAEGLFLAFHSSSEPPGEMEVLWALMLIQALQAVTLIAGGVLTGSGQRNGMMLGSVVGVWNGVFSSLTSQAFGQSISAVALYGDPLLQTALGALAGWLGGAIWKPQAEVRPQHAVPEARPKPKRRRTPLLAGRIAPIRVVLGTTLAVCGSLSATALYALIERLAEPNQSGYGSMLDEVVTWEIKALALFAGGVVAGLNTYNGLKQGLFVGIFSAFALSALDPSSAGRWLEITLVLVVGSGLLCTAGGWFGSQLFPPVVPYKRRLGPESMA
jgi:hypothetical protein